MNRITSIFSCKSSDQFLFVAGVIKRPGGGEITEDEKAGWLAYTEPEAAPNGRIHCGLIMPVSWRPAIAEADGHHIMQAQASAGQNISYFAGAGWTKGLDFPDHKSWAGYVKDFAARAASPLRLEF
jgi:hypothetical protein